MIFTLCFSGVCGKCGMDFMTIEPSVWVACVFIHERFSFSVSLLITVNYMLYIDNKLISWTPQKFTQISFGKKKLINAFLNWLASYDMSILYYQCSSNIQQVEIVPNEVLVRKAASF